MSTTTPNLGLTKPSGTDDVSLTVLNGNWDTIDSAASAATFTAAGSGAAGDGVTDDAPALQSMLNAVANVGGGTCDIGPGTYLIDSELEIKSPGKVWIRLSPNTVLKRGTGAMRYMVRNFNSSDTFTDYSGVGGLRITGGVFDAQGDTYTDVCTPLAFAHADRVLVEDLIVKNVPDGSGVMFNASRNCIASCCLFSGFNKTNNDSAAVLIEGAIDSSALPGVAAASLDGQMCDDVQVVGCRVESGSLGGFGKAVGSPTPNGSLTHTHIRIIGCDFSGTTDYAVWGRCWSDVTVQANNIHSCAGGVYVRYQDGTSMRGFVVASNTFNAISDAVSSVVFLSGNPGSGDTIFAARICDNIIRDYSGFGVRIDNVGDCQVSGNVVREGSGTQTAVSVSNSWYAQVVANKISGNGGNGIGIDKSSSIGSDRCLVANNTIELVGGHGIASSDAVSQTLIIGNFVSDAGTTPTSTSGPQGILVYATTSNNSHNVTVTGNMINKGNGTAGAGVWLSPGATAVVCGNSAVGWGNNSHDAFTGPGTYRSTTSQNLNYAT